MNLLSLHIFHSPIENESRLFKESKSLIKLNIVQKVVVLGTGKQGLPRVQNYDVNITILRSRKINIKSKNSLLRKFTAIFNLFLYFSLIIKFVVTHKINFISVHNLLLLPIGCLCKLYKRKVKLIYEPHELETERTGLTGVLKKISLFIEKKCIKYADRILTVCEPISTWYIKKYDLKNVYTIRNVPNNIFLKKEFKKSNKFRTEFNISEDNIIFIYQGVLDAHRGVEDLVDIFALKQNQDKHLILMGYGDSVDYILRKKLDNVHYKPAVPVQEIIDYTSSADIGIFFIDRPLSLSYTYCLPNKFFEYAIAGLPILVSDNLLYLSDILKEQSIGWSVRTNLDSLNNQINNISKGSLDMFNDRLEVFRKTIGWELEQNELFKLYNF